VEADRWLQLMNRALEEAMLPNEVQRLAAFFASTATLLMNQPER
jgi:truncated hemoglobin YjbI